MDMDIILKIKDSKNKQLVMKLLKNTLDTTLKEELHPSDVISFIIGMINFVGETALDTEGGAFTPEIIAEHILRDIRQMENATPVECLSGSGLAFPEMKVDLSKHE